MNTELATRYQTMIILWFALLMSVGMYLLFTVLTAPGIDSNGQPPSSGLPIAFTSLGAIFVILSFVVKQKVLASSVEQQDVGLVQKAMVVALALCEVPALLGVIVHFVFGSRQYYWLFLLAAAGMILHFPRRSQLEAARWSPLGRAMPRE